jgi:hypothetical protein
VEEGKTIKGENAVSTPSTPSKLKRRNKMSRLLITAAIVATALFGTIHGAHPTGAGSHHAHKALEVVTDTPTPPGGFTQVTPGGTPDNPCPGCANPN